MDRATTGRTAHKRCTVCFSHLDGGQTQMLAFRFIGTRTGIVGYVEEFDLAVSSLIQVIRSQCLPTIELTGKCYNPNRETRIRNPIFARDGVPGPEPRPAAAHSAAQRSAYRSFARRQAAG